TFAANGDANQSVRPGILRAVDATDVTKELWNSANDVNDDPGNYAKFNCPTIANGKVYLATFSNQLVVYGLRKAGTSSDGCGTQNLALNQTAYASSVESGAYPVGYAIDGKLSTRWSSQFSDPQYIAVDLYQQYDLCKVVLKWETALGEEFKIQISNDFTNWTDVAHITGNTSFTNEIYIGGKARYVRMYGIKRGTPYGYSLYEMQVFGKPPVTCPKPDSLYSTDVYGNSAVVHWKTTGAAHYLVQYKTVTAANWQQVVTDASQLAINNLACNTPYQYQVKAICSDADSSDFSTTEAFTTLACDANCDPLPTRWSTEDVGNPEFSGSACYNSGTGTFQLQGYGIDIGGTADQLRYAFKTLVGDGELKARITDIDNSDPNNKMGIMIRESLAPGARSVFLGITSGSGAVFITRAQTDGVANAAYSSATIKAPYWIKVNITGSVFTAYISPDGLAWTQLGNAVDAGFGNGQPLYAGLGITSHNEDAACTGHADNYVLSGVLPLKLISFTGNISLKNTVDLRWVTTLESNIKYFIVERTSDNMYYKVIDTVYAQNDGDYTEIYNVSDVQPRKGMNYYRLRIFDNAGKTSFSPIVAVKFNNVLPPKLYPNPANSFLNIVQGNEAIRQVNIYTVMGRPVVSIQFGASQGSMRLPVYNLSSGLYFVEIRTKDNVYRDKIIVHN
ncbi:MAG TPA: discoidin domain-containing protein, partial [Chitinophagaceae bacterium]|nr:discoidin domain-containing protein [Chitinophagaceae bacterium]